MGFDVFVSVLAATLLANGLTVLWAFALFYAEVQRRRGIDENNLPGWVYFAGSIPPLIAAGAAYYTFNYGFH